MLTNDHPDIVNSVQGEISQHIGVLRLDSKFQVVIVNDLSLGVVVQFCDTTIVRKRF